MGGYCGSYTLNAGFPKAYSSQDLVCIPEKYCGVDTYRLSDGTVRVNCPDYTAPTTGGTSGGGSTSGQETCDVVITDWNDSQTKAAFEFCSRTGVVNSFTTPMIADGNSCETDASICSRLSAGLHS